MKQELARLPLDLALLWQRQPGWLVACLAALLLLTQLPRLQPAPPPLIVKEDPGQRHALHAFREQLLTPAGLIAAQQRLLETAQRYGLETGAIDFGEATPGGPSRQPMRLPLTGHYTDLRAFLAEALRQQPALALRQLSIERLSGESDARRIRAVLSLEFLLAGEAP